MNRFTDQTAVVTGGAQGIGHAVAKQMADEGARVAIWDLDIDLANQVAEELGGGAFGCAVDISDWASVSAAAETTFYVYKWDHP